ncbi:hypothetical protein B566_EDAN001340 [Ephemera danica]|nr:hypothetical protein B566_EDAN001340 [Ephemera danica]
MCADSEYMDADEKAFEKLNNLPPRLYDTGHHMTAGRNNRMEPASSYETVTMNNTINTPGMPGEEITYAELALPKHPLYQSHTLGRPNRSNLHHPTQHEATVYAQIMDVKMGHAPLLAQHHAATLQRPRAMHVQVPAAPTLLRMRPGPEQGDMQNTPLIGHRESTV